MNEHPIQEEIELRMMLHDFFEKVSEMPMKEQIQMLKDFLEALGESHKESQPAEEVTQAL